MDELRDLHELAAVEVGQSWENPPLRIPAGLVHIRRFRSLRAADDALPTEVLEDLPADGRGYVDARREQVGRPGHGGVLPYQQQRLEVRHCVKMVGDELNQLIFWLSALHVAGTRWFFS